MMKHLALLVKRVEGGFARALAIALLLNFLVYSMLGLYNLESGTSRISDVSNALALCALAINFALVALRPSFLAQVFGKLSSLRSGRHSLTDQDQDLLVCYSDIPDQLKPQVVHDIAMVAYCRWPENATLESRNQFFGAYATKFPDGLNVALRFNLHKKEVNLVGYSALVPLNIENYLNHLYGRLNLFDHGSMMILDATSTEERMSTYASKIDFDLSTDGIAYYILGINVRLGLEQDRVGLSLMRNLIVRLRDLESRCKHHIPYMYCASSIPSVKRFISTHGFKFRGRKDINGNTFYEHDGEPLTPGVAPTDNEFS